MKKNLNTVGDLSLIKTPETNLIAGRTYGDIHTAATWIPFKVSTLYRFCCEGKIPYIKKGKLIFCKEDLFFWLESDRKQTTQEIAEAAVTTMQRANRKQLSKV